MVILAKNFPSWLHLRKQNWPITIYSITAGATHVKTRLKLRRFDNKGEKKKKKRKTENWLEYGPVCRALAVETSLLLSSQNVPDDDGLWVLLGVHQWTEGHHIPGMHHNHTWSFRHLKKCSSSNKLLFFFNTKMRVYMHVFWKHLLKMGNWPHSYCQ